MQHAPYFSVIIPTYNRAHLIRRTVESVLSQQDGDFEAIVVDDGSEDETEEVVRAIADDRVSYLRKNHAERGAARNYGAARARGRYFNFLDSDDLLYTNHLSTARRFIREHDEPGIFHLGFEMKDDGGRLLNRTDSFKGDLNDRLLRGNVLSCNGVFLRRDVARAFPFNEDPRLSASEDWELWLRLASRYPIHYSNEVTSVIINHDERSVLKVSEAELLDRKDLTLRYLFDDPAFVEKYGGKRRVIESEFLSYMALHLALGGGTGRACKYLKDSVLVLPTSIFRKRFLALLKHIVFSPLKGHVS